MSLVDTALALRALGFHPIVERPNSKSPLASGWQRLTDRSEAQLRADFANTSEGAGIGTVTHGFVVLDIDIRPGVNGLDSLRALPHLPDTLASETPTGGMHLFYRLPAGAVVRNSVSKLGAGIDVRGTGGQVVLPPTTIDGKPYRWTHLTTDGVPDMPMSDLPAEWLAILAGEAPPVPAAPPPPARRTLRRPEELDLDGKRRRAYMDTLDEPSIQGSGGNAVMMRAAFRAKEFSRSTDDALEELLVWNDRLATPSWSEPELARAIERSEAVLGAGLERDRELVIAPRVESLPAVPAAGSPTPDAPAFPLAWVESMQAYVALGRDGTWGLGSPMGVQAAKLKLVQSGVLAKRAGQMLAEGSVPYAVGLACAPGKPASFLSSEGELWLNTYAPSAIKPALAPFPVLDEALAFLTDNDPAGKKWLLNWMAFAVQNPARRMKTVPVVYGAQGTGKSLLVRVMSDLIGRHNSTAIRNEDLQGRFTSHFVTKLFVSVAEIQAADVGHATANLKYLTGEPTLMLEAKGANAVPVKSAIKMICTSNQTLPVLVEGQGDQRWSLFKQLTPPSEGYLARTAALFDRATNDWSLAGQSELAGLLAHLVAWTVDVDLAMTPYRNAARAAAAEASRSSVESFVEAVETSSLDAMFLAHVPDYEKPAPAYAHLDIEGHPELASASAVQGIYRAYCKSSGLMPLGTNKLGAELERYAPGWVRVKVGGGTLPTRPWAYQGMPRQPALRPFRPGAGQLQLVPSGSNSSLARAAAQVQRTFFPADEEVES